MRIYISLIILATVVLGLILFVFSSDKEPDTTVGVQTYQLNNGMKILVMENHRAPVVVSQVWYKVGSSYEQNGTTGVSHVLEHMMFKGTPDYPSGVFSEIIAANGGKENAFTSKDYTAYFQRIASDRLELCIQMEADRMRNLLLDETEFLKELEVVKEERRLRTDDNPAALTYERFSATAYINSPYRQPIIGWMQDLDALNIDDVRRWYKTWYAPNNATLVVVGDVEAEEVYLWAKEYFGPLQPSNVPVLKAQREVEHYGVQRIEVKLPARVPQLIMGYRVPVLNTADEQWEVYALEVLAGLLDGSNSARLSRDLIRGQQIATSTGVSYDLYSRQESLLTLSAIPANDTSIELLESALREAVSAIKASLVEPDELDRVKAQVVASSVYEQDSSFYQAMKIGILETNGIGWQRKDEYVERIQAVTAEQVQQVAKKYLIDQQLTIATLNPLPLEDKKKASSAATGGRHAQ